MPAFETNKTSICPVPFETEIRYFLGSGFSGVKFAGQLRWENDGSYDPGNDIIAYEVIEKNPGTIPAKRETTAATILAEMGQTFAERNKVYGSNFKMVAPMVKVLFPDGISSDLVVTHQWHLFELILVKLSRFAISNLTHIDSIHDLAVYGAMIEAILHNEKEG